MEEEEKEKWSRVKGKKNEEKVNYVSVLFCYTANLVCLGGQ